MQPEPEDNLNMTNHFSQPEKLFDSDPLFQTEKPEIGLPAELMESAPLAQELALTSRSVPSELKQSDTANTIDSDGNQNPSSNKVDSSDLAEKDKKDVATPPKVPERVYDVDFRTVPEIVDDAVLIEMTQTRVILSNDKKSTLAESSKPAKFPQISDTLPEVGQTVARYLLKAICGFGNSSVVFTGEKKYSEMEFALKFLNAPKGKDVVHYIRIFRQEARLLTALHHTNLIRFFDYEEINDHYYLVTELIRGPSLRSIIRNNPQMSSRAAARIIIQLIEVLEYLWTQRVIHRDLKPDNIMICQRTNNVKLFDLGLALYVDGSSLEQPELSFTSDWVGTPFYMSPEQTKNSPSIDFRSDIYSLGIIFYELVTGKPPFMGKSTSQLILHHRNTLPCPPIQFNSYLGQALNGVILRMIAKNPQDRFNSYTELRNEILHAINPNINLINYSLDPYRSASIYLGESDNSGDNILESKSRLNDSEKK